MSMKVGIDISNTVDARPTGVARYVHALVAALHELPDAPELTLCCRYSRRRRGDPGKLFPGHPIRWLSGWRSPSDLDLWHAPDLRLPRWNGAPAVVTIHDLSALERSDHATAGFVKRKRHGYQRAAREAA
ncbi:MAG: hypothetical protein V3T77_04490, partial [Planctomycetota bacterium]